MEEPHFGSAGVKEAIAMTELTEREEQEMIERAKAGDPKANYDMSFWALDRAQEDPEDERWNRLAAKCLVRSAEAGYAPARERMQALLRQTEEDTSPKDGLAREETFDPWDEPAPPARPREEETPARSARAAQSAQRPPFLTVVGAAAGVAGHKIGSLFAGIGRKKTPAEDADAPAREQESAGHAAAQKVPFFRFSEWDESRWKRMQLICIVVCVVLAILIAVMLITGRKGAAGKEAESQLPSPEAVETVVPTATPEPVLYPDEATRGEIAAADLEVYPAEEDYVGEETTATVDTTSGLNLRRGPGASYGQIVLMSSNAELEVYAYKSGWALVKYNGSTWGWCSTQYLK